MQAPPSGNRIGLAVKLLTGAGDLHLPVLAEKSVICLDHLVFLRLGLTEGGRRAKRAGWG